jgi:hypothetical protein
MKAIGKNNLNFFIGVLLSAPAAYFILFSVFKYKFGYPYLFDDIQPTLESGGINESFGFNINLLFLFGPVLALLLNMLSVLDLWFSFSQEKIDCRLTISKSGLNLAVVFFSAGVLFILGMYLFLESCT